MVGRQSNVDQIVTATNPSIPAGQTSSFIIEIKVNANLKAI